jgi:hypothetical protein
MRIATFLSAASIVLMGTLTLAQNITYDFDRATDFTRLKTFAWVRGPIALDEINHRRVVDAVNTQLMSKGLVKVDAAGRPDMLVAYHASFDSDVQITGFSSGWGPYRFGSRSGVARTEEIVTGTLAVDLVDARTNTIVWRGMATREVDVKADPNKRERNINRAAERLFKNYPPAK